MNKLPENFEELARFRQGMYRVFAAAFLPPQPERLVDLIGGGEVLESMGLPYLAFYQEWKPWREALLDLDDVTEIDVEHVRMFSTRVIGAVSPPTESFYTADPIRGEVGEVLADLARVYNELRLEPTGLVADTLDHVSIELEITLKSQVGFLEEHLGAWLPRFVERIVAADTIPFYATLGPAVASFVHHDIGVTRFLAAGTSHQEPAR